MKRNSVAKQVRATGELKMMQFVSAAKVSQNMLKRQQESSSKVQQLRSQLWGESTAQQLNVDAEKATPDVNSQCRSPSALPADVASHLGVNTPSSVKCDGNAKSGVKRKQINLSPRTPSKAKQVRKEVQTMPVIHVGAALLKEATTARQPVKHHSALTAVRKISESKPQDKLRLAMKLMKDEVSSETDSVRSSDLSSAEDDAVESLIYDGIPDNSAGNLRSAIKSWTAACDKLGIKPLRRTLPNASRQRQKKETRKMARVVMTVYADMKPGSKDRVAPKPSSAKIIYGHMQRLHIQEGYVLPGQKCVSAVVKSLVQRYIAEYTFHGLIVKRAEPWLLCQIEAFVSFPHGTRLGCVTIGNGKRGAASWNALQCTLCYTGLRKDEFTTSSKKKGFTKKMFSRASVVFYIAGVRDADPSLETLRLLGNTSGDGCWVKPIPSKADADGSFWCDKPIWLPFDENQRLNACKALVKQELEFPCHGEQRQTVPLFCADDGLPFTRSQLDTALKKAIELVVPEAQWSWYTWHSYRVMLASLLGAALCPPQIIKRMLRWISDESLRIYVRPKDEEFKGWLEKMLLQRGSQTVQTSNLPHANNVEHLRRLIIQEEEERHR